MNDVSSDLCLDTYATQSPVLFIVFNRPDVTKKTWEAIKKARPKRIYIAVDGARKNKPNDEVFCKEVKNIFNEKLTWDCEIKRLFRENNLGCKLAVSHAITWFFEHEEQGIILEDDCCPSLTFFKFCDELLERYKFNESIMQISGSNFINTPHFSTQEALSYYTTSLNDIWGWATWRRAWSKYSLKIDDYEDFKRKKLVARYFKNRDIEKWIYEYLDASNDPDSKVWSPLWVYCLIKNQGYALAPTVNLVHNIGMVGEGTNNSDSFIEYQNYEAHEIKNYSLLHPQDINVSFKLDSQRFELIRRTDPAASPRARLLKRIRIRLSKVKKRFLATL